jgi:hypothetical protein
MRIIRNSQILNVELLADNADGTYSYHWTLKGLIYNEGGKNPRFKFG